jgi:RNA polymerase sigma-70 factor, ECF subfamily
MSTDNSWLGAATPLPVLIGLRASHSWRPLTVRAPESPPSSTFCTTLFVCGSMRTRERRVVNHTLPSPTAIACGELGRWNEATILGAGAAPLNDPPMRERVVAAAVETPHRRAITIKIRDCPKGRSVACAPERRQRSLAATEKAVKPEESAAVLTQPAAVRIQDEGLAPLTGVTDTLRDRSDAQLLRQADGPAFGELYRRHASTVYRWFRRRLEWAASDLTAETFTRAWLSRRRFRDERDGSALPWLLGIANNVLRSSAKHDRIETRARERLGLPLDLAAEDGYTEVEERLSPRLALEASLNTLPTHERRALELRVIDELPYPEIAERLAIRQSAARLRVSRALRRLALMTPKEEL